MKKTLRTFLRLRLILLRRQRTFVALRPAGCRTSPSPSPRPSPSGRGSSRAQRSNVPTISNSPADWRRFPLSLRERAGVRGNSSHDQRRLPVARNLIVAALVLFLPSTTRAHVGSPNVFFEGHAGPYPVHVLIRP